MQQRVVRLSLIALATATAACDETTSPQTQTAQLRIVNAADVADVRVRLVGRTTFLAQDLDFRAQTTSCVEVPVGERAFVFTSGDVELTTAVGSIEAGKKYSAFLVTSGAAKRAVVVADDAATVSGSNALRFINATSTTGDVYVTPPGGAVTAGFLANGNLALLATSNLMPSPVYRSVDHTQVRLFDSGATTSARADITLAGLPASGQATVVFTNAGAPAGPTAFLALPCP